MAPVENPPTHEIQPPNQSTIRPHPLARPRQSPRGDTRGLEAFFFFLMELQEKADLIILQRRWGLGFKSDPSVSASRPETSLEQIDFSTLSPLMGGRRKKGRGRSK